MCHVVPARTNQDRFYSGASYTIFSLNVICSNYGFFSFGGPLMLMLFFPQLSPDSIPISESLGFIPNISHAQDRRMPRLPPPEPHARHFPASNRSALEDGSMDGRTRDMEYLPCE